MEEKQSRRSFRGTAVKAPSRKLFVRTPVLGAAGQLAEERFGLQNSAIEGGVRAPSENFLAIPRLGDIVELSAGRTAVGYYIGQIFPMPNREGGVSQTGLRQCRAMLMEDTFENVLGKATHVILTHPNRRSIWKGLVDQRFIFEQLITITEPVQGPGHFPRGTQAGKPLFLCVNGRCL